MKAMIIQTNGDISIEELADYDALYEVVGGCLECIPVTIDGHECSMWLHEEGKLLDFPRNKVATYHAGLPGDDYIAGPAFITGLADNDGESLDCPIQQLPVPPYRPTPQGVIDEANQVMDAIMKSIRDIFMSEDIRTMCFELPTHNTNIYFQAIAEGGSDGGEWLRAFVIDFNSVLFDECICDVETKHLYDNRRDLIDAFFGESDDPYEESMQMELHFELLSFLDRKMSIPSV